MEKVWRGVAGTIEDACEFMSAPICHTEIKRLISIARRAPGEASIASDFLPSHPRQAPDKTGVALTRVCRCGHAGATTRRQRGGASGGRGRDRATAPARRAAPSRSRARAGIRGSRRRSGRRRPRFSPAAIAACASAGIPPQVFRFWGRCQRKSGSCPHLQAFCASGCAGSCLPKWG